MKQENQNQNRVEHCQCNRLCVDDNLSISILTVWIAMN